MKTLEELLEDLKREDEIILLDILGVDSAELVDRFKDLIEEDPERFYNIFDDEEEEDVDG